MTAATFLISDSSRRHPDPIRRSPLIFPACGSCPTPDHFDKVLPWTPPQRRDYLRANAWGIPVSVHGLPLPWIPGITSRRHPERFLSYCFDSYPRVYQDQWIYEGQLRGYTHGILSWPNSRAQARLTLPQFADSCRRVRDGLGYVHVKLGAKDFDPHDLTLDEMCSLVDPVFEALNGVADEYSFWEYDLWNRDGQPAIDIHRYCGSRAHAQGASFWCHFSPHVPFWTPEGDAFWWEALGRDVDGLDYQGEPSWDIGELQARSVDILNLFARTGHKFRQFEPGTPSRMFDGDHPTEDEADAFGYLSVCTVAATYVWGGGAGLRLPDGRVL